MSGKEKITNLAPIERRIALSPSYFLKIHNHEKNCQKSRLERKENPISTGLKSIQHTARRAHSVATANFIRAERLRTLLYREFLRSPRIALAHNRANKSQIHFFSLAPLLPSPRIYLYYEKKRAKTRKGFPLFFFSYNSRAAAADDRALASVCCIIGR